MITDHARLRTYECDGLAQYKVTPALVVLPRDHRAGRRRRARLRRRTASRSSPAGSGTGLSGGALPHADGVLIVTSQMRDILRDRPRQPARRRAARGHQPAADREATPPDGYYYAPDPSSQQVCSIGGNVAENSGGAHCLKYGFTTNHVTGVELVTPRGRRGASSAARRRTRRATTCSGRSSAPRAPSGIATEVTVRLTRSPESVRTLLAAFQDTDDAGGRGVGDHRRRGHPRRDRDDGRARDRGGRGGGALRLPGRCGRGAHRRAGRAAAEVEATSSTRSSGTAATNGAFEIRIAADDAERALFWKGRKSAFAAVGRISPDYIVQDGVIPRTALPEVLRRIAAISAETGVRVANVFHAGDGNLHPLVLFDDAVPGEAERAEEVSGAILDLCIEHGGSITGEHGVGSDKAKYMPRMFDDGRPRHDAAGALRVRPRRDLQPRQGVPHAHGCAARCPGGTEARTRWPRPAWRRSF